MSEKLGAPAADSCRDPSLLMERYATALWLEEREVERLAAAIAKAFGGDEA